MESLSHQDILLLNQAIGEIYTARDHNTFFTTLFTVIESLIPAEYSSCSEISLNPTCFLKINASSLDHLEVTNKHQPALNAHIHEHPLTPHFMSETVFKTTDYTSIHSFKGTAVYNEYYRHLDVEAQMGLSIPVSPHYIALLGMNRHKNDFTERDRLLLTLLRPHLIGALRSALEFEQANRERQLLRTGTEVQGQGIVLCAADGTISCLSPFAGELLAKYFEETTAVGTCLPGDVRHWCNRDTEPPHQKERTLFLAEKDGARLAIRQLHDLVTGERILLMTESKPADQFRKLQEHGLSRREAEVLLWLARGKTNPEIAMILGMGKRTVEKHLEHVFIKLGVETRTAATALVRSYC